MEEKKFYIHACILSGVYPTCINRKSFSVFTKQEDGDNENAGDFNLCDYHAKKCPYFRCLEITENQFISN